ncbi:uncharacterized protein LOC115449358 isoform X3 [Manduca sexta]|uniref:uncharacterized protein LOC115449358 isoform X3 n=1 Tax=Manduca sexta TaxID=7130 RepID=UPI001182ED03|nr:uncharacterized protein LOC115449358 isoform X3 [Manduca sexta]
MGETEEFNTLTFEKKLMQLKDTQESIQSLSSWCLRQRTHHKKIVSSWLNVLKRVKVEQRLVLFYLANDVIQYSKRKNYEFVESWGLNLQKATPLVRDDKVRPKILRIFKIWEQRSVYDDEFLSDLTGLLSAGATKKADDDALDFQPQQLVNKIKQCAVLEADTDMRLKCIHDSHLQLSDADELCASLKDRSHKDDVEKELNEGIACVERYTQSLQREIVAREALLALLTSATQYYSTQRGEVKVVAYAYKNFGARVRSLKRKLDELIPSLPHAAPSPPQRDEDVPSPGPDEDLDLPANDNDDDDGDLAYNIDQTFNSTLGADGSLYNLGLSSFLMSENPMALFTEAVENGNNANKIEVINSRPSEKQDFNITEFLKNLIPFDNNTAADNISVVSASISQKSQDTLPGLDLLTPESTGNPAPPTSFYGTMEPPSEDPEQAYNPERSSVWSGSTLWNVSTVGGARGAFAEGPESPPQSERAAFAHHNISVQDIPPVSDVDHRGLLPPPPPPPVLPLLGNIEDVDHRLLPALTQLSPAASVPPPRHTVHQDVDHRNLIPLTQEPPVSVPAPRPMNPNKMDQDYRVPPVPMPSDIVESVDMDLSEDEEQHVMYGHQQQNPPERRHSFNNNKVLVGGDNGKTNHTDHNLIRKNELKEPPHSAPVVPPMVNPFDAMPPSLKNFNPPINKYPQNYQKREFETPEKPYNESRHVMESQPAQQMEYSNDSEWHNAQPRPYGSPRVPRHWAPRTNYRPQFSPQQFWPRNSPRPSNRWNGPRPQRFW